MIRFLKKIRLRMLPESKFSKYLLYAIGEIVLVVIGILIALQLNNWNENRKNNIEEIAILEYLEENLLLASKQSEELIANEKKLKNTLIGVLGIEADAAGSNNDSITNLIFKDAIWEIDISVPIVNAYIDLKNTNKLRLIKNQKIKEKFTSLEVNLNGLKNILDDRLNVHQIRIDNVVENDINFIPLLKSSMPTINIENEKENDYKQILKNQRIRNLLAMKLILTKDVLLIRENLDKEIKEISMLIKTELKRRR